MRTQLSSKIAILVTLAAGAFVTPVAAQPGAARNSDREHDGLKGLVRTVRVEVAKLRNDSGKLGEGRRCLEQMWTYDPTGFLTDEVIVGEYHLYTYDDKGNRFEKRNHGVIQGPPKPSDFYYQQARADDGSLLYKWVFTHDANGNRIEEVIYEGDREPYARFVYPYDERGNRKSSTRYDAKGLVTLKYEYSYGANGRINKKLEYKPGSSLVTEESYDFEFDGKGNWIKKTASKLVTKKGKTHSEPYEVTYRTIIYYLKAA